MAAHVFCLMLNLVAADIVDPAPPPQPAPAAEPAPPAMSVPVELAAPVASPTPVAAQADGRERMRSVTEMVLDLPYAATAMGLWGVTTIVTLLALTTDPSKAGVNLPTTPGVQPWTVVRVTGVVLSLALGLATAALLLFPPSALKSQLL